MLSKIVIGTLVLVPVCAMEKPAAKVLVASQQVTPSPLGYSNDDRDSIIATIAGLKQGHLLYPIGDSAFKASIKHALLDGKELAPPDATVKDVVEFALVSLSSTIRRTCPRRDFLDCVEVLLEQIDERYEEEAKLVMRPADAHKAEKGASAEVAMQLAYAAAHYEQFNQKELKYMVNLDKPASVMLQEKLQELPKDTVQSWYAEFMKGT